MEGAGFKHVGEGRDVSINSRANILKIDEQRVEGVQHPIGGVSDFTVEAKNRDVMARIDVIIGFDHVILLVAAHAVLRTKGRDDLKVRTGHQGVKRMAAIFCHRGRMPQ